MDILNLKPEDRAGVWALYRSVRQRLRHEGIRQWDLFYPNRFVIDKDIRSGCLYGIRDGERIIAAVSINRQQSSKYSQVDWADQNGSPAVLHRLAVHPDSQGRGLGKRLLRFAEYLAHSSGFTSIRLDVYSANPAALAVYERTGYQRRGDVRFPFRKAPYICMEKVW
jgi:ribosomal protein S18 acetylase RimI-like enzyme